MTVEPTWRLALALVVLVAVALAAATWTRLPLRRPIVVAAARVVAQLAVVSFVIVAAVQHLVASIAFVVLMFVIAVWTTGRRTDTLHRWPWVALTMASGAVPVLAIIFGLGVAPFTGLAIIPIAGILVGNMMTVHTLVGRRAFAALRDEYGTYEAALAVGLPRADAIDEVIHRHLPEALVPGLDQTRTTGLVTLPGAFIGVLLGGGSPVQAGAAQVLVLIGILAGQFLAVSVADRLIRGARLVPKDLIDRLHP
ncbi:ABC transporter permease [Aestuariimicrobium soli]|uniref:ABC transporter permease n=1 Tax=Aestuariimicrobium soli TaxID=2035834 RepID=UPI003EBBD707